MITPVSSPMSPVRVVEERLQRGVPVRLLLPPVTDEHERAHADQLPTDEQLERVVGDDQQQHRRGEERERREEVREAAGHRACTRRVHVNEQRDQRDDEHHHHGEPVDLDARGETDAAVLEPRGVPRHRFHDAPGRFLRAEIRDAAAERAEPGRVPPSAPPFDSSACHDPVDPLLRGADRTNNRPTAAIRPRTVLHGMRLPNSRITTNDTAGMSGTNHAFSRSTSAQSLSPSSCRRRRGRHCAGCGRSAGRSEPDPDFGRGDGEHEQGKHLTGHVLRLNARERDQVQVHRR